MNYKYFCQTYFAATGLPIQLYQNGQLLYSSIAEVLNISPESPANFVSFERNPAYQALSPDLEYGQVRVEETDYLLVCGPTFSIPVTEEIIRQYAQEFTIPLSCRETLSEFLFALPTINHIQLMHHLQLIHLFLNGKETNLGDYFQTEGSYPTEKNRRLTHTLTEQSENSISHFGSYAFEMKLYQLIAEGNFCGLQEFFASLTAIPHIGQVAQTPLRQTKNIFIGLVTKTGMLGAIPGGLDTESAYRLMDFYSQECEKLQSVEDVNNLYAIMLVDFCKRVQQAKVPDGISAEIYECINFIRSRTNEPISVEDVAAHIGRSSSYVMKHFKSELNIHTSAFIMRCKLEEAKSLLVYTSKSLAEISNYLCFSSQAYFQTVFKKKYGITPAQYRREHQLL